MSVRLVNVDRNTPMLLPPDMREWMAQDGLAHFVLEAAESLDCAPARRLLGERVRQRAA